MRFRADFLILSGLGFIVLLSGNMGNPFLPLFAGDLGAASSMIGLVMSSYFFARIFLEIPSGYMMDRFGYRIPLIVGFASMTVAGVLAFLAADATYLMASRMLSGFGSGLFFNASMNIVARLYEKEERGEAMGVFQGIEFSGSFLGAPIGGFLASWIGYRDVFLVSTAILLPALAIVIFSRSMKAATEKDLSRKKEESTGSVKASHLLRNHIILLVCFTGFFRMFPNAGIMSTIAPIYLNQSLGYTVATIGLLMGARAVGMSTATLAAGSIMRIIGEKRTLIISLLVASITTSTMVWFPQVEMQAALFLINGAVIGILMPVLVIVITEAVGPSLRGTAIGMYRTSFALGAVVAPILMTSISDLWGIEWSYYLTAVFLVMNALLVLGSKID